MLTTVLLCVAVIVLSVPAGKPYGWVGLALGVLALLSAVAGWPP
jgi:hypothetical protein